MYRKKSFFTVVLIVGILFLFLGLVSMVTMPSSVLAESVGEGELPFEDPPLEDGSSPPDSSDSGSGYGIPSQSDSSILNTILRSL